jgi:hypothetical protein
MMDMFLVAIDVLHGHSHSGFGTHFQGFFFGFVTDPLITSSIMSMKLA